jgi:hypothetical protein
MGKAIGAEFIGWPLKVNIYQVPKKYSVISLVLPPHHRDIQLVSGPPTVKMWAV